MASKTPFTVALPTELALATHNAPPNRKSGLPLKPIGDDRICGLPAEMRLQILYEAGHASLFAGNPSIFGPPCRKLELLVRNYSIAYPSKEKAGEMLTVLSQLERDSFKKCEDMATHINETQRYVLRRYREDAATARDLLGASDVDKDGYPAYAMFWWTLEEVSGWQLVLEIGDMFGTWRKLLELQDWIAARAGEDVPGKLERLQMVENAELRLLTILRDRPSAPNLAVRLHDVCVFSSDAIKIRRRINGRTDPDSKCCFSLRWGGSYMTSHEWTHFYAA
ncbi:MAG: hypothetical protein M1828_007445 [Chrysothrix sp. TS-e1954]|nr:MAG: hypothetical protein M1828_007445 [Chrysothrix sp. TS-e1954]